jgi:hypothetical protein
LLSARKLMLKSALAQDHTEPHPLRFQHPRSTPDRQQRHCIGDGADVTCACRGRELSLQPGKSNIKARAIRTAIAAPNISCVNGGIRGSSMWPATLQELSGTLMALARPK